MTLKRPARGGLIALETSHGDSIQLCVFHQIDARYDDGKIANFTIGGVSVCYGHLEDLMVKYKKFGYKESLTQFLETELIIGLEA